MYYVSMKVCDSLNYVNYIMCLTMLINLQVNKIMLNLQRSGSTNITWLYNGIFYFFKWGGGLHLEF